MDFKKCIGALLLGGLLLSSRTFAIPFPSPDPAVFGPDLDGDGYFSQDVNQMVFIEALDIADFEFGFFFEGSPTMLNPIFDSGDSGTDPIALIDFAGGFVYDIDDDEIQSLFTPSLADFGYYISFGGGPAIFSDPLLNGGLDVFAAFPLLDPSVPPGTITPTFIDPATGDLVYLGVAVAVAEVDEPTTWLMLSLGALLLAGVRRRHLQAAH